MHHLDLLKVAVKKSKTYFSQMMLFTMVKKNKSKKNTQQNKSKDHHCRIIGAYILGCSPSHYPPVNKPSNGKSPSWIGNTSSNGGFSIAMLDYRSVIVTTWILSPKNPSNQHPLAVCPAHLGPSSSMCSTLVASATNSVKVYFTSGGKKITNKTWVGERLEWSRNGAVYTTPCYVYLMKHIYVQIYFYHISYILL